MMTNFKFTSKCAAIEPKTRSSLTVWSKLHMYTKLIPLGYLCYYLNENVINGERALCHLSLESETESVSVVVSRDEVDASFTFIYHAYGGGENTTKCIL